LASEFEFELVKAFSSASCLFFLVGDKIFET
jgi:hypothetical protein